MTIVTDCLLARNVKAQSIGPSSNLTGGAEALPVSEILYYWFKPFASLTGTG